MSTATLISQVALDRIAVSAYTIPTDAPEADGTFSWDKTTLVLVEATAGDRTGLGYTYADTATARLIDELLAALVKGRDTFAIPAAWSAMVHTVRNLGRPGIASIPTSSATPRRTIIPTTGARR